MVDVPGIIWGIRNYINPGDFYIPTEKVAEIQQRKCYRFPFELLSTMFFVSLNNSI